MENLLVIQENEFSATKSMHPLKVQLLYTHASKLVTSDVQICFPSPYLNLHAKYSICICHEAEVAPVSPTQNPPRNQLKMRQISDSQL